MGFCEISGCAGNDPRQLTKRKQRELLRSPRTTKERDHECYCCTISQGPFKFSFKAFLFDVSSSCQQPLNVCNFNPPAEAAAIPIKLSVGVFVFPNLTSWILASSSALSLSLYSKNANRLLIGAFRSSCASSLVNCTTAAHRTYVITR